jgi:hypothetical protein
MPGKRILFRQTANEYVHSAGRLRLVSLGRRLLLGKLQEMTRNEIGRTVHCTGEFVSQIAAGIKKPERYRLRMAFEQELGIPASSWDMVQE